MDSNEALSLLHQVREMSVEVVESGHFSLDEVLSEITNYVKQPPLN